MTTLNTIEHKENQTRVILKDGSAILFRPITVNDVDGWLQFYSTLSDRTKFLRLHHIPKEIRREDALKYCTIDYKNSFAFVAEAIEEGEKRIVAVGRYNRLPDGSTAEIAFVIEDKYHETPVSCCYRSFQSKRLHRPVYISVNYGRSVFRHCLPGHPDVHGCDVRQGIPFHPKSR